MCSKYNLLHAEVEIICPKIEGPTKIRNDCETRDSQSVLYTI